MTSFVVITCMMITSCGNNSNPEADALQVKLDSQMVQTDELNMFLELINTSLDSIIDMEGSVLRPMGEGNLTTKEQILQNIDAYKLLLKNQNERIAELEEKLKNGNATQSKMLKTLESLKSQLAEKDKAITELTEELDKRNFDIKELKKNVSNLNTKVTALQEETKAQEEALIAQSDMMNEAYVLIASKKQLKQNGLLSGGTLFKKSKLDASNIDVSLFEKIDIRNASTFSIPSTKAEVLTQMPKDSYTITKNGDNTSTLNIIDATRFWSVSNYLIIKY